MPAVGPSWYGGAMRIAKNEDWRVKLQYNVDYTVSGDPENIQSLDLTGSTMKMQIRHNEADHAAIVSIELGDGIEFSSPVTGEFELTITRERLVRLQAGEYVADIVRTDGNGYAERLWAGQCIVVEGVTR